MKKDFFSKAAYFFMLIIMGVALMSTFSSCKNFSEKNNPVSAISYIDTSKAKWVDWNIMFSPGADSAMRAQQEQDVENYINAYLAPYGFIAKFTKRIYCPCDSSLFNLTATPVQGSGGSLQAPSPPPPPPAVSGGNLPYTVSINNSLDPDMPSLDDTSNVNFNYRINIGSIFPINHVTNIDETKILAIMDTGLDPDKFDNTIGKLIWKDPHGPTLRNFFAFNSTQYRADYGMDDYAGKHGSAVTMIALKAMGTATVYPKIMVLKVFDANEKGSTFNIGCALSYAIKHHATIVNASLGYNDQTGVPDAVLSHYLSICNTTPGTDSVFVFAAAGNMPQPHDKNFLCGTPTLTSNQLYKNSAAINLFYPACFNDELPNVISVTGLQDMNQSCYFQHYSSKYVSLGVLNADTGSMRTCCQFALPPLGYIFEGSSFATPVASGKAMAKILNTVGAGQISVRQSLNLITGKNPSLELVTKDGRFIGSGANQ